MPFAPSVERSLRWRPVGFDGLEHLTLRAGPLGVTASGVVIGERDGRSFGVSYQIECDAAWRVRVLDLRMTDGRALSLRSDGDGHWRSGAGEKLPEFDGCIDIDLASTPFTNTLPIRRLALPAGGRAELSMVYVPFDDLFPVVDRQIYTAVKPGAHYLYEAADGSFAAELEVDTDGLVTDYPTLFLRC
jgi:uncharacterized protein